MGREERRRRCGEVRAAGMSEYDDVFMLRVAKGRFVIVCSLRSATISFPLLRKCLIFFVGCSHARKPIPRAVDIHNRIPSLLF
jgi:hypothetical protein